MVVRNSNFAKLKSSYLFQEIGKRKAEFLKNNPNSKLISLGIGDTSEPLTSTVVEGIKATADRLGDRKTYTGYPDYNGSEELRALISEHVYKGIISKDEIYISDGSKPDLARLQTLFAGSTTVAVQDPVYPAYVDGNVINGRTGEADELNRYESIVYMPCNPDNGFFPDLSKTPKSDIIYLCSPNNPTGSVATREQLTELVAFAKKNKSLIIFDAAYFAFIKDESLPKTIFEIPGAKDVAMESNSFSKVLGFTGVRLGWTVCPANLQYEDGSSISSDWQRICGTFFNGPSNLAEGAAIHALRTAEGRQQMQDMVNYYMNNATHIRKVLLDSGFTVFGGVNAPYVWLEVPKGQTSWDVFQELLEHTQVVTTPGAGFGSEGQKYIRISAFAHKENVEEGLKRIDAYFKSTRK